MRKLLVCILVLVTSSCSISAQPWLFPGKKKVRQDSSYKVKVADTLSLPANTVMADSLVSGLTDEEMEDLLISETPDIIRLSLMLPLKSNAAMPNRNFMDYYCGALMAVRDLGLEGCKVELSVYDTEDKTRPADDVVIENSDIIIGPVKCGELEAMAAGHPDKYIISPIEPKAAGMADSLNIIQAPSSWAEQTVEMIAWLKAEFGPNDRLIVLKDNSVDGEKTKTDYLMYALDASGLQYSVVHSSASDALVPVQNGTLRVIVASGRDVFICSSINSISTIAARGECPVVLYTTSSVRSLEGINAASLFNANTRMTASYYVDYESEAVKKFTLDYRALFNHEPTSFSFSGYDTVCFYSKMCRKYGSRWYKRMHRERQWQGLQTDFKYVRSAQQGRVNQAVRRVVYNPDFSIRML